MKRKLAALKTSLLAAVLAVMLAACSVQSTQAAVPDLGQVRSICSLATLECYYHNVAKFREENAEGVLFWQKDKHFWIEYSGVVSLGIDVSQVTVEVDDTLVTITIPEAEVLRCQVDSDKLSEDSYIVAKNSAKISAEDEVAAFAQAQADLEATAAADTALLLSAQQRAQALLEEYVENIGEAVGKDYTIQWVYLDGAGTAPEPETNSPASESPDPASA